MRLGNPMYNLGDKSLIFNPELLGPLFNSSQVVAIYANIQNSIFSSCSKAEGRVEGSSRRVKFSTNM